MQHVKFIISGASQTLSSNFHTFCKNLQFSLTEQNVHV